jgi:malonyl CoA-acyl carrier protein transacylase
VQPAIYVASLAAVEKLRATEGAALLDSVDVTCGLSLGEYTALAFAGACGQGAMVSRHAYSSGGKCMSVQCTLQVGAAAAEAAEQECAMIMGACYL